MMAAVYKHGEVAALFSVDRTAIYDMPHVMACRLPGTPVRYSKRRIDALLNGEVDDTKPAKRRATG